MNGTYNLANWPDWAVMWGISFAIYFTLKIVSFNARTGAREWNWRHPAYLLAWPGMDADAFLTATRDVPRPALLEWSAAVMKMLLGLAILFCIVPSISGVDPYWIAWAGMVGIVMTLHFGLFHFLSCLWRSLRVDAVPIMNRPLCATSLGDFWGRRWNLAFRDLTYRFLFRPLHRSLGPTGALLVGFFVSGLIHDLVMSVPAHGGYGLPTCYFTLQGLGIVIEKTEFGRWVGLGCGIRGRIFCLAVLLLPCGLLFHRPFVLGIILPFVNVMNFWMREVLR